MCPMYSIFLYMTAQVFEQLCSFWDALRCKWCQNPETLIGTPQIMMNYELCEGCGACIAACPIGNHHSGRARACSDR